MSDDRDGNMLDAISDAFDDLEPIPDDLRAAARDAISWRRADVALAEILFDSSTDELVGVRGAAADRRSFRFGHGDTIIRVHLTDATLIVMIEPPAEAACRVMTAAESDEHRADQYGELVIPAPELPVRVEVDLPDGTVATPWITG